MARVRVTMFTRACCELCDAAEYVIKRVQARVPFEYETVDISQPANSKWDALYTNDIPVVHINGEEAFRHRVKESDLAEAVKKLIKTKK